MDSILLAFLVFAPIAASPFAYLLARKNEARWRMLLLPVDIAIFAVSLLLVIRTQLGFAPALDLGWISGLGIHLEATGFGALYACVANLMWLCTSLFSGEYFGHATKKARYVFFLLLTQGATSGVFLSADLLTTLLFFECMSFASYPWVAQEENTGALRAADTYLAIAVIGGLSVLLGIFLLYDATGTVTLSQLPDACASIPRARLMAASLLMLLGFGAKAGVFLVHIWLPKAHPVAPAPASALLSGVLTKTGIFGILVVSRCMLPGDMQWGLLLLVLGMLTMLVGAILALLSVDLKRTLACSSVSQIGFITLGVATMTCLGEENGLAAAGTVLHMLNHSMIKLVLFQCAGVVYMRLHTLNLNDIRGFGRKKPFLLATFLIGALSIGGVPMMSGYISKTLLHESIVECIHEGLAPLWLFESFNWLFLVTGGLTLAYMTKLFVVLFVQKHPDAARQAQMDAMPDVKLPGKLAIGAPALLLLAMGFFPNRIMVPLSDMAHSFLHAGHMHEVAWLSMVNLEGAFISLGIGAAVYFGVVLPLLTARENGHRLYINRLPLWMDLENTIYRPVLFTALPAVLGSFCKVLDQYLFEPFVRFITLFGTLIGRMADSAPDALVYLLGHSIYRPKRPPRAAAEHKPKAAGTPRLTESFSFGLLVTCLGICALLLYMLFYTL